MKRWIRKSSFFVMMRSDKGFTLIEALVSLVIFLMITSLVLQLVVIVQTGVREERSMERMEWEIFLNQVKREVRISKERIVESNKLIMLVDDKWVTLEMYHNLIRRRVDGKGHDIMLQNVNGLSFRQEGNEIMMTVTDSKDKEIIGRLRGYIIRGESHEQ